MQQEIKTVMTFVSVMEPSNGSIPPWLDAVQERKRMMVLIDTGVQLNLRAVSDPVHSSFELKTQKSTLMSFLFH